MLTPRPGNCVSQKPIAGVEPSGGIGREVPVEAIGRLRFGQGLGRQGLGGKLQVRLEIGDAVSLAHGIDIQVVGSRSSD